MYQNKAAPTQAQTVACSTSAEPYCCDLLTAAEPIIGCLSLLVPACMCTHSAHVLSSKTEACRGMQESFPCLACGSTPSAPYLELLYLLLRIRNLLLEQVTLRQKCFVFCLCWASQADLEIAVYRRDKGLVSAVACWRAVGLCELTTHSMACLGLSGSSYRETSTVRAAGHTTAASALGTRSRTEQVLPGMCWRSILSANLWSGRL